MLKKLDLSWGESVCVRQAFTETASWAPIGYSANDIAQMGYTPHEGDPEIIALTHRIIKRQTGLTYKHVILTNGATGAVTISLRAYASKGYKYCYTDTPHFPLYPSMITSAKMYHSFVQTDPSIVNFPDAVHLIDSPSNPLGKSYGPKMREGEYPIIWDAVYHNNVYGSIVLSPPDHDVVCGSYSKLLGINGIRIGWIATNNDLLYDKLHELVTAEYAGLSAPSFRLLKDLLITRPFYWNEFEHNARYKLDWNREEWSKLERYFGGLSVNPVGMFYYGPMDQSLKDLMTKAGIVWTDGKACGDSSDMGRFNLGQDNHTIKAAVKAVLKADKA